MIETPEAVVLSRQLSEVFAGKNVSHVQAAQTSHGFAWYEPEPEEFPLLLTGKKLDKVCAFGGRIEMHFDDMHLVFNDGITPHYLAPDEAEPKKHQLLIRFQDGSGFFCTVRMYGGMMIYPQGKTDNFYHLVAHEKPSPLSEEFNREYFHALVKAADQKLSAKALLATEQRIPGLGNGVLQDILFNAAIHPQRKVVSLNEQDIDVLFESVKETLRNMTDQGARDTEKDIYGKPGGYKTILSNKTKDEPCPNCGGLITVKAFLGGKVYFCPTCQQL